MKEIRGMKILALICFLATLHQCLCARNELTATADCVCPGQNFTYECTVVGGRFTVWSGTVISGSCEVTLFHSMFGTPGATSGKCNNGAIVGYNIGVENNCYTSKLDILVSPGLNGSTVKCIFDNVTTNTVINTSTLVITTTPFPPPTDVQLVSVMPQELTFIWSPPPQKCPSLVYNVISSDCGICQNNSSFSNTTCRDFALPSTCTLTIQSIICGNLVSTMESSPVIAELNVPEAPIVVDVNSYYSESDRRLLRLTVNFNITQSFQIADGIDGSAISYNVTYSDSASGSICGSATIPASSCLGEMCGHSFSTSSSLCPSSANINVTVFATNVLGNGLTSVPLFQDGMNNIVDIDFNSDMKAIICTFLNQPEDTTKECSINITYGPNCDQLLGFYTNEDTGDSVSSPELPLIESISEYCFTAIARSNNVTVNVEGTLNLISQEIDNAGTSIAIPAAVVPVVTVVVVGAVITALFLVLFCYNSRFKHSLIVIKFSNPDEAGSLAQVLKVFKDNGINIVSINTYWTEDDIKRNLCGRRQTIEKHDIVHISCTNDEKIQLKALPNIKLEFIEDKVIQEDTDTDSMTTGSTTKPRTRTIKVFVADKPGALWEVLNEFGKRSINILGLNTRPSYDITSTHKDNFVSCKCSIWKQRKIVRILEDAGAFNISVESDINPSTRTLQFYVKDEPGALAGALKAFRDLNINTTGINPTYMKLPTHDIPGHETIYVECECGEDKKENLFKKLRKSTSDAVNVQFHDEVISTKTTDHHIVKFSIQDKVGSLVTALEVFQDLKINILGVNSFDAGPGIELRPKINVEYKRVQMMVTSESDIDIPDLISELQSSGHITDVQCNKSSEQPAQGQMNYNIKFLARHQVGTLVKALSIFINHDINIVSLSQESVSRNVRYAQNHIRFVTTHQLEVRVISELYATGLVMDVKTFVLDDHHKVKTKESHTLDHTTIKGELHGNAFEREPQKADTQV